MSEHSQREVILFLSNDANLPERGPVRVIRTHGAVIFLAGETAYKMKRDVRYDYLDFSDLAKRRDMLRRELDLNAPTAPSIYRDVIPVTRDGEGGCIWMARAAWWSGCFGCTVLTRLTNWTKWPNAECWMTLWRRHWARRLPTIIENQRSAKSLRARR